MTVPGNHTHRFHQKHNICTTRKWWKKKTQAQRKQICSVAQTGAQRRLLLTPSTTPSAPGVDQGESPQIWHRPPAAWEAQVRQKQPPNLFILVWFRQRQKNNSPWNQHWAFSSTFVCYENQEDSAQKAKRGNWASHEEQAGSHPRGSHNTGLCHWAKPRTCRPHAAAASSGPSHPPWIQDYFHGNYLENLLSKKKPKNSLNTQTLRS